MFGFGKGKIEIQLEKYNFCFGDTIKGKVILKMKQPVEAKGLRIALKGERKDTSYSGDFGSGRAGMGQSTRTVNIFELKLPLDREKTYSGESEHPFEIKIPKNIIPPKPKGVAGDVLSAVQLLSGRQTSIKWFLDASLDIPGGMDISKKVNVNIG